jgi:hypothetical protein
VGARLTEKLQERKDRISVAVDNSQVNRQQSILQPASITPDNAVSTPVLAEAASPLGAATKTNRPISDTGYQTKPSLPSGIAEYFLPQTYSLPEAYSASGRSMPAETMIQGVIYRPALLGSAQIRFLDRKLGVDSSLTRAALVEKPARNGSIRWEDYPIKSSVLDKLETAPAPGSHYQMIDAPLNDSKRMAALQKDFTDWVYRNSSVKARSNQTLKVFAGPDVTQADFMKACADAARAARDLEIEKSTGPLDRKIKALEEKIAREEREVQQDQTELGQRKNEELGNLAELGASLVGIGRKKSLTTQLTKRRLTEQAKGNVEDSIQSLDQYKKDLADLQKQRSQIAQETGDRWGQVVNDVNEVNVTPKKTDIFVNLFGVAWVPFYLVQAGDQAVELPAFGE